MRAHPREGQLLGRLPECQVKARHGAFFVLLALAACGRRQPPPEAMVSKAPLKPWTCQILNGVLVVQGEVDRPMDLVLEGRSIHATHHAAFGPVRWEMFRPPTGEVAQLRTAEGQVLARWRFGAATRMAAFSRPRPAQDAVSGLCPETTWGARGGRRGSEATGRSPSFMTSAQRWQPTAAPEPGALERLRRQLMPPSPLASAPEPSKTKPSMPFNMPTELPTFAPVMSVELAPMPRRRWNSEPSKPRLPENVDSRRWPQPQPLPILPVPPLFSSPRADASPWEGAGEGFNLVRGPKAIHSAQRRMVLSFDGGSSDESAEEILDALRSRGVRTTIFLTGTFIQKYPDLVRRMEREGHELGNHTLNHPHFAPGLKRDTRWTKEKFQEELLAADRALYQVLGRPMDPYWRAPYGEQTRELREWAEEIGFRHVGWSEGADTLDWATASEKRLYRNGGAILERLHARLSKRDADGLIVLMHLGSGRTEADRPSKNLGAFMDRARQEGWQFVKVGDYLQDLRKPSWNPGARLALLEPNKPRTGGSSGRAAMRK